MKFPPVVYGIEARERGGWEGGDISGRNESLSEASFPYVVVHALAVDQFTLDRGEALAGEIEVVSQIRISSSFDFEANFQRTIGRKNTGGDAGIDGPIPHKSGIDEAFIGRRRKGNDVELKRDKTGAFEFLQAKGHAEVAAHLTEFRADEACLVAAHGGRFSTEFTVASLIALRIKLRI